MDKTSSGTMLHRKPYLSKGVQKLLFEATGLLPKEAIQQLFEEEGTLLGISQRTGINRTALYQAMAFLDIERPIYNQSEHMKKWYESQPPETGARLTKKAHQAVKGMRRSHEELVARAINHQKKPKLSKGERLTKQIIDHAGIPNVPHMAVDIYNIDIAIPSHQLAIEVNGGNWHTAPRKKAQDQKKRRHLESQGWKVVYLWGSPDKIEDAAKELVQAIK